ncbi:MAG: T9SS type A sorting domain-containing protein [Ignavibacteriales bacterium]|nr:T9SS type A sorting domain-containing protein [Ignavibacteriales bacterium]
MKKIKTFFILLFLCLSSYNAQVITFDSVYTRYKNFNYLGSEQRKDSSYLVAIAIYNPTMKIVHIDQKGRVIGYNDLTVELFLRSNPLCNTSDGGWTVVSSIIKGKNPNSYVNISLTKFSSDNKLEWQKFYGDSLLKEYGMMVMQMDDSGFLILAGTYVNPILIRTDSLGNLIWMKHYKYPALFSNIDCQFIKLADDKLVIANSSSLLGVNQNGDSLWTTKLDMKVNSITPLADGGFLACVNTKLYKFNKSGNILWQKDFPFKLTDMVETYDKKIALVSYGQNNRFLKILDEDGNLIRQKSLYNYNALFVKEALDKGLIISGASDYIAVYSPPWLMKTNNEYEVKRLSLTLSNYTFFINDSITINWRSEAVNKVDLYYSTDDGVNWIEIVKNLPDTSSYVWVVPETPTIKGKLKIVDAEYPELFDISEISFRIFDPGTINYIDINQILMFVGNNGMGSHDPRSDGAGLYWPGGKDATIGAVFQDGLIWGGKVNGVINVNGNTHRNGLQPGKILSNGLPDTTTKPIYNIWKIRKDWESLPPGSERDAFEYNYNNWPGELGAPYEDINHDGQYTKGIDKPKFEGDETLWFVANDLDSTITHYTYGSEPIGLEVQATTYGYNRTDDLADVVFKKYKIINKSNSIVEDMYFGYWSDTDLGDGNDDYVGCDTLLNFGFTYNADNIDGSGNYGYGTPPPALGYLLLQGPKQTSNSSDSAFFNNFWHNGFKNLGMSSFVPNMKGSFWTHDPSQGRYEGTLQFYNLLNGLRNEGEPMIDPNTGDTTKFGLAGDPVAEIGWYEGKGWPPGYDITPIHYPGDRRLMVTSGSFNFAPGDTQEVVYAIIIGRGTDNINSIKVLKDKTKAVKNFYYLGILSDVNDSKIIPEEYKLYQNFPNPFNPTTTIKYSIPERSGVELKIFDVLGKEVTTLVNEEKTAGNYEVKFDGSKLASGIYIYRLKAGNYFNTKKLVLIK